MAEKKPAQGGVRFSPSEACALDQILDRYIDLDQTATLPEIRLPNTPENYALAQRVENCDSEDGDNFEPRVEDGELLINAGNFAGYLRKKAQRGFSSAVQPNPTEQEAARVIKEIKAQLPPDFNNKLEAWVHMPGTIPHEVIALVEQRLKEEYGATKRIHVGRNDKKNWSFAFWRI